MFGERLKLARKMAGYSLRGLAGAFGGEVTAQAIGKYERGEMMPSSGVLLHMARVLGGLPTPCISPESRPAGRWWTACCASAWSGTGNARCWGWQDKG